MDYYNSSFFSHGCSDGIHTILTVRRSLQQALPNCSFSPLETLQGSAAFTTTTPLPCRQGAVMPLGLQRPLDNTLEDKILRGEYIDFSLLLPDSLSQPEAPKIKLRLDDSIAGPTSSLTMVGKCKPVINTFHKCLDTYTSYMLLPVALYPQHSLKLLKYQQIISRAATKFKGLTFFAYK